MSFLHMVKNQSNRTYSLAVHEFFPFYLQMYTKDIQLDVYKPGAEETEQVTDAYVPKGYTKHEYKHYRLDFDKGNIGLWFSFSNITLEPQEIMVLRLKLKKRMINAQSMPVDVSMDANVPSLPIVYREVDSRTKKAISQAKVTYSPSWLITIMEPDFSMAFNLNAMTCGVLGVVVHYLFAVTVDVKNLFS